MPRRARPGPRVQPSLGAGLQRQNVRPHRHRRDARARARRRAARPLHGDDHRAAALPRPPVVGPLPRSQSQPCGLLLAVSRAGKNAARGQRDARAALARERGAVAAGRRCLLPRGVRARLARPAPPAAPGAVGGLGAADAAERRGARRRADREGVHAARPPRARAAHELRGVRRRPPRRRRVPRPRPRLPAGARGAGAVRPGGALLAHVRRRAPHRHQEHRALHHHRPRRGARARPRRRPLPLSPRPPRSPHAFSPSSTGRVGPARAAAARLDRPRAQPRPRRRGAPPRRRRRQRGLARRRVRAARGGRDAARVLAVDARARFSASRSDVLAAATQRLDAAIADVQARSAAALLDKLPASPGSAQSSPNSVLNAFVGGAAPSSREALKPRTFCVTLPFGSLGGATSASSRGEPSSAGSSQHAAGPSSAGSLHGVPRDGAASSPSARAPGVRTPRGAAAAAAAAAATRPARCGRGGRRRCAAATEVMPIEASARGDSAERGRRPVRRPRARGGARAARQAAAPARHGRRDGGARGSAAASRAPPSAGAPARAPRPRASPRAADGDGDPARPPRLRRRVVGDAGGGARRRPAAAAVVAGAAGGGSSRRGSAGCSARPSARCRSPTI